MDYLIRSCLISDLPAIVALCQKHADYERALYDKAGKEDLLCEAIFTGNPKLYCYVVEIAGRVAGYFSYTIDFSTWDAGNFIYLDCLFIDTPFRGAGIGMRVFEKLKQIAKQQGCINIQWQTPESNEAAIRFYKRIGGIATAKARFVLQT